MTGSSASRVLCLDVGERRIGVAVSDALGLTAQPLTVLGRQGLEADVEAVCRLAHEQQAEVTVVGLPVTLSGAEGQSAEMVREFGRALEAQASATVEYWDERFSTAEAERAMRAGGADARGQRGVVDKVAAALILQSYLDAKRRAGDES
ncbi:MAG: Holliday junction resolvase RuvX [Armatimonadota bacterium]